MTAPFRQGHRPTAAGSGKARLVVLPRGKDRGRLSWRPLSLFIFKSGRGVVAPLPAERDIPGHPNCARTCSRGGWMDDWLVGYFTIFGFPAQHWMLVADFIILTWIAIAVWDRS
jgi:hypothetical protein